MAGKFNAQTSGSATAYAIDLTPRQAMRTLEQAIRHHAEVALLPRAGTDETSIIGRAEGLEELRLPNGKQKCLVVALGAERTGPNGGQDSNHLATRISASDADRYAALIATYCDVTIRLGVHRYLFSSDVVGIRSPAKGNEGLRLYLARPATLQVAQRRRFRRFLPQQSSQVQLHWINDDRSPERGVAWLCNIGPNGIACRTEAHVADRLWIGAVLKLEFVLAPSDPRRFTLDASLCNKTPAGTQGKMILGLQFLVGPGHESSARQAESLREHLLAHHAVPADAPKGADK